jgi:hypothetical protein
VPMQMMADHLLKLLRAIEGEEVIEISKYSA